VKGLKSAVKFQSGAKFHVVFTEIQIIVYMKLDKMSALCFTAACISRRS